MLGPIRYIVDLGDGDKTRVVPEEDYIKLQAALAGVVDFARRAPSAPFAGPTYRAGYEDGKSTTCETVEMYVRRILCDTGYSP